MNLRPSLVLCAPIWQKRHPLGSKRCKCRRFVLSAMTHSPSSVSDFDFRRTVGALVAIFVASFRSLGLWPIHSFGSEREYPRIFGRRSPVPSLRHSTSHSAFRTNGRVALSLTHTIPLVFFFLLPGPSHCPQRSGIHSCVWQLR